MGLCAVLACHASCLGSSKMVEQHCVASQIAAWCYMLASFTFVVQLLADWGAAVDKVRFLLTISAIVDIVTIVREPGSKGHG